MHVSIIIVSFNTVDFIGNCIDSVLDKTEGIDYEIIVVDNHSPDDSVFFLKARYTDMPNFKLLELPENVGFGIANNEGFKIAKGQNVLLLNPDTVLLNNAVKILYDYLVVNPCVGICGGNLFDGDMKPMHSFKRVLPGLRMEFNNLMFGIPFKIFFGNDVQFNHKQRELSVGYITGADMMIRKSILDKVGHFNPVFFMYYEETELTYRIKKAGYKVMNVPSAEIQHLEGKSFGEFKESRERMILESKSAYLKNTLSPVMQIIVWEMTRLGIYIRLYIHLFYAKHNRMFWQSKLKIFKQINRGE